MKTKLILILLSITYILGGCKREEKDKTMEGYIPIYSDQISSDIVLSASPRAMARPGKIYIYNDLLFIVEFSEGVHIVDNSNKEAPVKIGFYQIPGCTDMAVKNSVMYVNYGYGIAAINIANPINAEYLNYTQFSNADNLHPEQSVSVRNSEGLIVYKCPEAGRGDIIGWKYAELSGEYCTIR